MRYLLLIFCFLLISCNEDTIESEKSERSPYSFFVAGHTYGNTFNYQLGFHPPFKKAIPQINSLPNVDIGILTGDIVPQPTSMYFDAVLDDLELFQMPIHVAAGNHDRSEIFTQVINDYYYSFQSNDDLFIILSPTNWNIENEQKEFLLQKLEANKNRVDNIFIFVHELIWWSPENKFGKVEINYRASFPGSTNYWNEIEPILKETEKDIVLFAGDLGTKDNVDAYMYHKDGNITYIASGMGGGTNDNIIFVEVDNQGHKTYKLLGLNRDRLFIMNDLESYKLP